MKKGVVISVRAWIILAVQLLMALLIALYGYFPMQVETGYATLFYPSLGTFLRYLNHHIPFSIGDVGYSILIILLVINLLRISQSIYRKQFSRQRLLLLGYRFSRNLLWVYIVFKLIWGLNYDRLGIAWQLQITKVDYSKEEVTALTQQLVNKVNECRRQIPDTNLPVKPLDSIYNEAYQSFANLQGIYPFIQYSYPSVKPSLYNFLGDYIGFSGYYNPFTGEAQLRTDIPRMLVPYIACHEIAHQLGYASESEANFVGYLAAASSGDVYVRYSVYNDLFSYAQSEQVFLYSQEKDFVAFEKVIQYNREHLDTLAKKDRRAVRDFFAKRKNSISPAVSSLYDQYLKMNKQTKGLNSYNEVIGWLIAYQKKYGKI